MDIKKVLLDIKSNMSSIADLGSMRNTNLTGRELGGIMGKSAKGMEKSMGGIFKSIGSMISNFLSSALGPLALVGMALTAFSEPLQIIIEPLQAMVEIIGTALYPILIPIADTLWKFTSVIVDLGTALEPLAPMIQGMIGVILIVVNVMVDHLGFAFKVFGDLFEVIFGLLKNIGLLITGQITIEEFFDQIWSLIRNFFGNLIGNIVNLFGNILGSIVSGFSNFGDQLADWFMNLPRTLMDNMTRGFDQLGDWWDSIFKKKK